MIHPIVFGKFILLERISVGGMAEIYRAKLLNHPEFEQFFAVKRILPHLATDSEFVKMFINEAKVAVELEHPNVCQIYELGRLGTSHYIAMEYIAGRDVLAIQSHYRREKKIMSVSQACFIIMQAAQGLDYAHKAQDANGVPLGLVHRDVSPQNLLVTYDGVVKVIDFGIAKASTRKAHTQSGVVKGKFSYMSPEQAADQPVDHRSDIFALGILLWELLTGRRLFQSESEFAILEMVREGKIEKPSYYNKVVPAAVDKICMKALERDVTKRYQWAGEMVTDLWDFINGCDKPFTQWHLQQWMCSVFKDSLQREWDLIPTFKEINTESDIERYNQEHDEKKREEQNKMIASEQGASSSENGAPKSVPAMNLDELPPVPGKTSVESRTEHAPEKSETTGGEGDGARLSVKAKQESEENLELVSEGVTPKVSDPIILRQTRARRKEKTRRALIGVIVLICICFIGVGLCFFLVDKIRLYPAGEEVTTAEITLTIEPEIPDTSVTLQALDTAADAQTQTTTTSQTLSFTNLTSGAYQIDVQMPKYEPQRFKVRLKNGKSKANLKMKHPLQQIAEFTVQVSPENAILYVDGKRVDGDGAQRMVKGIIGAPYKMRAFRYGYEETVVEGTFKEDMGDIQVTLNESLVPNDIQIKSFPEQADVYTIVNGEETHVGQTPMSLENIDTNAPLVVELRKPGYETWNYTIDFDHLEVSDVRLFGDMQAME